MQVQPNPERNPIRILPRELAEKIAAGEVVERPASVIKELVENSIDAGAQSIKVELFDGGRKRLVVTDDGSGIPYNEVPTALERHATSKITKLEDLWGLYTMGFRGEALPSVAAVSRFTIETRFAGERGRRIYLEGGAVTRDEMLEPQHAVAAHGTIITVEDLFYNVPARLKFQKAKSGESAHIRELLERIALCNPKIQFSLFSDGRKSLQLKPAHSPAERFAQILETSVDGLESFESQFENITVRGWLDRNHRASNSRYVYLSVNGRMVRDKLLQQAVLIGLRPRMMEGEYPRVFLEVFVPVDAVDVNVHPAKSEVRFEKARDVFQVVHGALDRLAKKPTQAFYDVALTAEMTLPPTERSPTPARPQQHTMAFQNDQVLYRTKPTPEYQPQQKTPDDRASPSSDSRIVPRPGFEKLHYIGQLKNTYLLFQDAEGLVVVDQHAAHERIRYEKLRTDFEKSGLVSQPLLLSIVVRCKPEQVALALDHVEDFQSLGYEFEAFGDSSLVIRSAPEQVPNDRLSEMFTALLTELEASESSEVLAKNPSRLSAKTERMIATAACHSSVRAGQSLSPTEAIALASQMDETESALNCPHGRPASIRLSFSQIEGLFKRV